MSTNEILVYVLLVIVVLAFFREWAPPDIVAIGAMCFLIITKVLTVDDVLAVFSHPAPITIAS
ncbi:MAG: SLC13 family permease, partial [Verrucomicrobiota bacterium]